MSATSFDSHPHGREDATFASALGDLARFGAEARSELTRSSEGRGEFLERAKALSEGREPRRRMVWAVVPALAAVAAAVVFFAVRRHHAPVDYAVEGAASSEGGFIAASSDRDAFVKFTDGSSVELTPGATGRVNELRDRGARFSVERGAVSVHIQKREGGADYDLNAGPYGVHVTGTRFELGWNPSTEALMVQLDEGSVIVRGPHAEAGVGLRAGQTLTASPSDGVRIVETKSHDGAPEKAAAEPSPAPTSNMDPKAAEPADTSMAIPEPSAEASAASSAKPQVDAPKHVAWAERVAKGDFASVLAEADNQGIGSITSSGSLEDLMALADAARYGGRGATSAQALRAVRQRFAGSKPASTAAFLLGRMAEDGGNAASAIQLYDATISEGGTFAGEALGRKMMLVRGQSGPDAARSLADQYLQMFPKGPYADKAKTIQGKD